MKAPTSTFILRRPQPSAHGRGGAAGAAALSTNKAGPARRDPPPPPRQVRGRLPEAGWGGVGVGTGEAAGWERTPSPPPPPGRTRGRGGSVPAPVPSTKELGPEGTARDTQCPVPAPRPAAARGNGPFPSPGQQSGGATPNHGPANGRVRPAAGRLRLYPRCQAGPGPRRRWPKEGGKGRGGGRSRLTF